MAADATPVRLTIESDEVRLNTVNQDQGTADAVVEAQSEGTPLTVAFNPQYLADGVEAAVGEEVVLDTLDALKPAVVRPVDRAGLPVPPDAGAGPLTRVGAPPRARRLPQLRATRRSSSAPGSPRWWAPTVRASPT